MSPVILLQEISARLRHVRGRAEFHPGATYSQCMSRQDYLGYAARTAEAQAAHRAIHETFARLRNRNDDKDPATIAWKAAIANFHRAVAAAYPPGFGEDIRRLKARDWRALEPIVRFLEADPYFFGSGYAKADLLRHVKRAPLSEAQSERLRAVLLAIVQRRGSQEFRHYCRLAGRLATHDLRAELKRLAESPIRAIAWRSRRMLLNVEQALCAAAVKS